MFDKWIEDKEVNYKEVKEIPDLEVPPDLVTPRTNDRYKVPDTGGGKDSQKAKELSRPPGSVPKEASTKR